MDLYCKLLEKNCIREECSQYNNKRFVANCLFYTRVGHFLYNSPSPMEWASFIRYLEEIRPRELNHKQNVT